MPRAIALRILFDKNVPVGVRGFLAGHEVRTVVEMGWPPQPEKRGASERRRNGGV
jgi:hypothetical protein